MADYGIAVKQLDSAGGQHLAGGNNWFYVEEQLVVVHNDPVTPHAPPLPITHAAPVMSPEKSSWMFIDEIGVIRQGHRANCEHQSTGRPWFTIPD